MEWNYLKILKCKLARFEGRTGALVCGLFLGLLLSFSSLAQESELPLRKTIIHKGIEREYYIHTNLPNSISDRKWLLIVVHGGGGNGRSYFLADGLRNEIERQGLEAMIVAPSFSNTDVMSSRFPVLGEGEFLKQLIKELQEKYPLHKQVLITGYSRGGQFSHRFALQNPELIKACAPFAAGTWSTPKGTLLIEGPGEILHPKEFLSNEKNKKLMPKRLHNLFEPRVIEVSEKMARDGAKDIPFLIMCGNMDPRINIALQFADQLNSYGFNVKTVWTDNPHGEKEKYQSEFKKYAQEATRFFIQSIQ